MTTFTSEDRENAKLVEEAPYHPGYEDAVVYPTVIVDSGASVDDREDSMQMLRDQIHAQQCEINALRKALMYAHPKDLTDEEIGDFTHRMILCCGVHPNSADINVLGLKFIVEDILRKAQEK